MTPLERTLIAHEGNPSPLLKEGRAYHSTAILATQPKNAAYPKAFNELKAEGHLSASWELRQVNDLNNLVEQDHRLIKRLTKG
jgi:transposase, IS6 family